MNERKEFPLLDTAPGTHSAIGDPHHYSRYDKANADRVEQMQPMANRDTVKGSDYDVCKKDPHAEFSNMDLPYPDRSTKTVAVVSERIKFIEENATDFDVVFMGFSLHGGFMLLGRVHAKMSEDKKRLFFDYLRNRYGEILVS